MTNYQCTNCTLSFDNFPAAHNHELAMDYKHITLATAVVCRYCFEPREGYGWHNCPQAQEAKCRLEVTVSGIKADMMKPHQRRLTSNEMKQREDRRHLMATSLRINGRAVAPEYSNGNQ